MLSCLWRLSWTQRYWWPTLTSYSTPREVTSRCAELYRPMPAVTDHASKSEYRSPVIAVFMSDLVSYMTQAWVSLQGTLHLCFRLNTQHVPCAWLCFVHMSAHLGAASHLVDFAFQPAQLRLPTCTPCGLSMPHMFVHQTPLPLTQRCTF